MSDRRRLRQLPELEERDLEGVPSVVLAALMALFDHLEVWRPLTYEEQSTREVVSLVRDSRNQLLEERFGRGTVRFLSPDHPALRPRRG